MHKSRKAGRSVKRLGKRERPNSSGTGTSGLFVTALGFFIGFAGAALLLDRGESATALLVAGARAVGAPPVSSLGTLLSSESACDTLSSPSVAVFLARELSPRIEVAALTLRASCIETHVVIDVPPAGRVLPPGVHFITDAELTVSGFEKSTARFELPRTAWDRALLWAHRRANASSGGESTPAGAAPAGPGNVWFIEEDVAWHPERALAALIQQLDADPADLVTGQNVGSREESPDWKYWSHLAPCGRDPGLRSSFNPLLRVSARLLAAAADEARAGRFCFHEIMLPTLATSRGWPIYWLSVDSDGYSGRFRPVFPDSELTILLRPHWGPGDARIAHPVKHWPHAFYPRPPLGVAVP